MSNLRTQFYVLENSISVEIIIKLHKTGTTYTLQTFFLLLKTWLSLQEMYSAAVRK